MCRELTQNWRAMRSRGLRITSISDNSLNVEEQDAGGFSSLAQEMAELPVPQSYRMQLLEAFSAFDTYLDQLLQLLTPIIGRLPALLEPWVRQAARLQEKWSQFFLENSPEEFFLQRSAVVCDNCKTVTMRFRYFFSDMALGRIWSKDGTILFHLGVGKEPEPRRAEPCSMADEEFEALRLMGNPARARMLQAMMYRTMTIQELSKALGLNPGSVHVTSTVSSAQSFWFWKLCGAKLATAPIMRRSRPSQSDSCSSWSKIKAFYGRNQRNRRERGATTSIGKGF